MFNNYLLTSLIGLSLISSLLIYLIGSEQAPWRARGLALLSMIGSFIIGLLLLVGFNPNQPGFQFQENYLWIKAWNIYYAVGVDGISLSLIILTLFIMSLVVLSIWPMQSPHAAQYLSTCLLIQAFLIGSFAATDAIFFYVCWEAILIPVILSIGIWGSQERAYAALKLFMYTFVGSMFMLLVLLYLGNLKESADFTIHHWYPLKLNWLEQLFVFSGFFIAFAIKVPLWPLHTWLPHAHTEAPTESSMILAALMLKLGSYGLLRFCLPIAPDVARWFAPIICIIGLIAIIYGGLVALAQQDMKRLIAYSSIAHMGLTILGIFLVFLVPYASSEVARVSLQGAFFQMIAHAITSAGLFFTVGILYQRFHTRTISHYQGLAHTMPLLASCFMIFALSNLGLPGTGGFVGEFFVIMSTVQVNIWMGLLAAMTVLLSASYTLYLYGRLFWGEVAYPQNTPSISLKGTEKIILILLAVSSLSLGILPMPLLNEIKPTLDNLLQLSLQTKL